MDRRASSDVGFKRDGRAVQLMESDVMHLYIGLISHCILFFFLFLTSSFIFLTKGPVNFSMGTKFTFLYNHRRPLYKFVFFLFFCLFTNYLIFIDVLLFWFFFLTFYVHTTSITFVFWKKVS